jgi:hypothetical protein
MNKLSTLETLARAATEPPKVGRKYIVKFGEHWQQDTYTFDCGDTSNGVEYFWGRDDCDECPLFFPDTQQWISLDYIAAANPQTMLKLCEIIRAQHEALEDMHSGWRYIREQHGDLYGVGWDRAENKARAALAKANEVMGDSHE